MCTNLKKMYTFEKFVRNYDVYKMRKRCEGSEKKKKSKSP